MKTSLFGLSMALIVLMAACWPGTVQQPAPAPAPLFTVTVAPPAADPTSTSSWPPRQQSEDDPLVYAPGVLPTKAATPTPIPTLTDLPNTVERESVHAIQPAQVFNNGDSPDGQWHWSVLDDCSPAGVQTTRFASADGKTEWRLRPEEDESISMQFDRRYYQPIFWLPNESYVYLVGQACCADGPAFFQSGVALARLDLATGRLVAWPSTWTVPYAYSFSPTGAYLLSTYTNAHAVQVYRLLDGSTVEIPLPETFDQAGGAAWSPDGRFAVLQVCKGQDGYTCAEEPLILIDPRKGEFATIVSDVYLSLGTDPEAYSHWSEWLDAETFVIYGPSYRLVYSPETGALRKLE